MLERSTKKKGGQGWREVVYWLVERNTSDKIEVSKGRGEVVNREIEKT